LVVIFFIVDAQAVNVENQSPGVSFGGVGIICKKAENVFVITSVIASGPAYRSLLKGDTILAIDNRKVTGWDLGELVNAIKGEVGTTVTLTINRNGTERIVSLIRERVFFPVQTFY